MLLISGIIGLLMLQMGLTARQQVANAQALADRAELQLAAQSRESALLYTLLTEPLIQVAESKNPYVAAWNFRGEPFTVDGVTFSIQDESGRLRVPLYGADEFTRLLAGLGVDESRAHRLGAQLMQLQGIIPRLRTLGIDTGAAERAPAGRHPLQEMNELRLLPDMDEALFSRLRPLMTLYPTPGFNPLTAPQALIQAQLSESQAAGVRDARAVGQLDSLALWKLTGIQPDEVTVVSPGPGLTIQLDLEVAGKKVRRATTFIVRPYQSDALAVWQRSVQ
jgi:type II secretory pathway component PulK